MRLAQRIPKSTRRTALKPDQKDLGDIRDNIKHGDGNKAAADFGICSRTIGVSSQPNHRIPSWGLTALPIHLNQECRNSNLSCRNGEIEKENRDPREKKKVMEFAQLHDKGYMVSKAV